MSLRFNSPKELQEFLDRRDRPGPAPESPKQQKFRNVLCEADGLKFRSKKERARYLELCALRDAGACWFLWQVPFRLPGGTKYVLDFLVFWADGHQTFEDSKGVRTPMYVMKKRQVEALYPIRIVEP
jgi:hypothetical protein